MNISKKLALGAILACATWASTTMAATETEKLNAINAGLNRLFLDQQADGHWISGFSSYNTSATGAAVTAFLSQKTLWGANTVAYQATVDKAVTWLLANASIHTISTRPDGANVCPGGSGNCNGIWWNGEGEPTYSTGQVVPALMTYAAGLGATVPTGSGALAGLTWSQIAQGIANQWAQSQAYSGAYRGGWHYSDGSTDNTADGSTTQWGVLSLIYATNYGATIPAFVKTDLGFWLAAAQVGGYGGAGCYDPYGSYCDHSDTGALLLGLKFTGKTLADAAVVNAVNFLKNNWGTGANNTWYGNFGQPYAMYGVYKGLEVTIGLTDTTHITPASTCERTGAGHLPGNPVGATACNWWQDYNDWLVKNQNANGSWNGYSYWVGPLATAYDISILAAQRVSIGLCDANSDGFINTTDLAIISAARGQHATGTNDPRDGDGDLMITPNDVKVCITKQTH